MELTQEQFESAQKGEIVRVKTDSGEFVIVKADVYDKLAGLMYDDIEPRDAYEAGLKAWDADGSPDDETEYRDFS